MYIRKFDLGLELLLLPDFVFQITFLSAIPSLSLFRLIRDPLNHFHSDHT
jgi:hypothetical protein